MNEENNNLGFNNNPVEPVNPVGTPTPVENPTPVEQTPVAAPNPVAAPTPVETPAPAAAPAPVETSAPVGMGMPDLMAPPTEVAPVETPAPVEAPVNTDVQAPAETTTEVNPTPAPVEPTVSEPSLVQPDLANPGDKTPKKNNLFLVIVFVLVFAIIGVGCYVIMNLGGRGPATGSNTTTTSTTTKDGLEISSRSVTTKAGTTTAVRTTRDPNSDPSVKSSSTTVKIGKYSLPVPTGYEIYTKGSTKYPQVVSVSDKIAFTFQPVSLSYSKYISNYSAIEEELQSTGFEVLGSATGSYGNRSWSITTLGGRQVPSGFNYFMLASDLDSSTTLVTYALVDSNKVDEEKIIATLSAMIDAKTNAFDSSDVEISETNDYSAFDELDERLLA